ncbi:MAG TPA: hypothetical protein VFT28_07065 [Gemmatimonadales bacterium]|nr:hypothetical protein [Gemmatimonadales bacterium]
MRVLVLVHPDSDSRPILTALSELPGVEITTVVERSLFAIARIRAEQPDLIVADTDGYDFDRGEPVSWLSSHLEAPHTVLLRRDGHRRDSAEIAGRGRLHCLTMPRDRDTFVALVRDLATQSVPPS